MFKKLSVFIILILSLSVLVRAADITDIQGITGKLGKEDVSWGTGQATDTFTVPTYSGSTTTLTKVPNLDTDSASKVKGVWYPAKITGDHGSVALTGSLAWILSQIGSDKTTIELPGNQTYQISTNLVIPSIVTLRFQHGALISIDTGKTLTISYGTIEAPDNQIFTGLGTVAGNLTNAVKNNAWFSGTVTDNTVASGTLKKIGVVTSIDQIGTIGPIASIDDVDLITNIDEITTLDKVTTLSEITTLSKIGAVNVQGDIYYHNGTKIVNLPPGVAGQVLVTNGVAANPVWAPVPGLAAIILPPGVILPYGGAAAPVGYLLCNGAAISRITYLDLFTAIGTTYGVGDNSTTFNLPDLRQRFPIGKADAGTASTLGATGGAIDHNHTLTNHTHDLAIGDEIPNVSGGNHVVTQGNGSNLDLLIEGIGGDPMRERQATTGNNTPISVGTQNPPYQVVNFIIKT